MEPLSTFDAIYDGYRARIFRYAQTLGLRDAEAEDVTQDVFEALYRAMIDSRVNLAFVSQWLTITTRYRAWRHFAFLRHQGAPAEIAGTNLEPKDTSMADTNRRVMANEDWTLVNRMLDDVDPHVRDVFVHHEINEETLDVTATALKRPLTTVFNQQRAAREQFDAALARHRAKERRTSRGAASMLPPIVPASSFGQRLLAWIKQPVAMIMSRGGLALTAGTIFAAGAGIGVLASNTRPPAPRPGIEAPAPIFAAASALVDEANTPAPALTVLADGAPPATVTPPRPVVTVDPEAEKTCLELARSRLMPPTSDPNAAIRLLERCERRFPRHAFPERYTEIRQQARDALAGHPQKP